MGRRFGRNQKRKMREEIDKARRYGGAAHNRYVQASIELDKLRRKAIFVDVAAIANFREGCTDIRVKLSRIGGQDYYVAQKLMDEDLAMRMDRENFIKCVSEKISAQMLEVLGGR